MCTNISNECHAKCHKRLNTSKLSIYITFLSFQFSRCFFNLYVQINIKLVKEWHEFQRICSALKCEVSHFITRMGNDFCLGAKDEIFFTTILRILEHDALETLLRCRCKKSLSMIVNEYNWHVAGLPQQAYSDPYQLRAFSKHASSGRILMSKRLQHRTCHCHKALFHV